MAAAGEVDRKNIIRVCLKPSCDFVSSPAVSPPAFLFFVQNSRIAAFLHLLTVPHCQVVASRPVAFYTSLAKRLLWDNATVELSAIGECFVTFLVLCRLLFYAKPLFSQSKLLECLQYSITTLSLMYLQARP